MIARGVAGKGDGPRASAARHSGGAIKSETGDRRPSERRATHVTGVWLLVQGSLSAGFRAILFAQRLSELASQLSEFEDLRVRVEKAFFHVHNVAPSKDEQGEELPDDEAAWREATTLALCSRTSMASSGRAKNGALR